MALINQYLDNRSIHDKIEPGNPSFKKDSQYENIHISYGVISKIDTSSYQVTVTGTGNADLDKVFQKMFMPLYTDRDDIFLRWGQLRQGLACRIVWHGMENNPTWGKVEVIGSDGLDPLRQAHIENDLATVAYKIFGGGLLG